MTRQPCTATWCEPDHSKAGRCWRDHGAHAKFSWGRCKSGKRWFWFVDDWRGWGAEGEERKQYQRHGWEDDEASARAEAVKSIRAMAGDLPVSLDCSHTQAQSELQRINRAKLKERLAARPSASKDGAVVEYLYAAEWSDRWDHDGSHWGMPREWHVWRFRITKKTKKRIYYMRKGEGIDGAPVPYCSRTDEETIGYIDREAFEMADTTGPEWRHTEAGEIFTRNYYSDDYHLYAAPPPKPPARAAFGAIDADTLKKLKAEMAAAHPDKGGTNEAFREARQRYVDARRRCERAA